MRSAWLLLALALPACKKTEATTSAPPVASSSVPAPSASPSSVAPVSTAPKDPASVAAAWNDAMTRHDTVALSQIYAPEVTFYGTKIANAKAVASKASAFAKTPDYAQSIGAISEDANPTAGVHVLRFTKTTTEHGKKKDYPAKLGIADGHVVEENDDRKLPMDWCLDADLQPTDKLVPPFKVSAEKAFGIVTRSKYVNRLEHETSGAIPDTNLFGCAEDCSSADHRCDYSVRVIDSSSTATSNLVDWIYVDPKSGTVWHEATSDAGLVWVSEAPTPP